MMISTHAVTIVSLTDVMQYMGYSTKLDDASDIFDGVSYGDSAYTLMSTQWVLDTLYDWLDADADITWTDNQAKRFTELGDTLLMLNVYVDMES